MRTLAQSTTAVKAGTDLSVEEVNFAVDALVDPAASEEQKAEFLSALAMKGETAEEIAGFAGALRGRAVDPHVNADQFDGVLLDVCGTGADMAQTFNISTCVMFVVAAAGIAVAKHGNRAVTSKSGSADVLIALGAKIDMSPEAARRCLETTGLTFFFAPLYHPAFKVIAPIRKLLAERKQRTVFNILGPLVNPSRPTHQLVGIFDPALVGRYAEVLRLLGVVRAMVVHGDGLDEFSIAGVNTVAELWGGRVEITQRDFHVPHTEPRIMEVSRSELAGGDPSYCAHVVREVLGGQHRGPRRDIVLLNTAAALVITGKAEDFLHGWKLAADLIDSGAAAEKLETFVEATNAMP